jgi:hypothetical protein
LDKWRLAIAELNASAKVGYDAWSAELAGATAGQRHMKHPLTCLPEDPS